MENFYFILKKINFLIFENFNLIFKKSSPQQIYQTFQSQISQDLMMSQ